MEGGWSDLHANDTNAMPFPSLDLPDLTDWNLVNKSADAAPEDGESRPFVKTCFSHRSQHIFTELRDHFYTVTFQRRMSALKATGFGQVH